MASAYPYVPVHSRWTSRELAVMWRFRRPARSGNPSRTCLCHVPGTLLACVTLVCAVGAQSALGGETDIGAVLLLDGGERLVVGRADGEVSLLARERKTPVWTTRVSDAPVVALFSLPAGAEVLSLAGGETAYVHDERTGDVRRKYRLGPRDADGAVGAFAADAAPAQRLLVFTPSAYPDQLRVINVAAKQGTEHVCWLPLPEGSGAISAVKFCGDRLIFAGSSNGELLGYRACVAKNDDALDGEQASGNGGPAQAPFLRKELTASPGGNHPPRVRMDLAASCTAAPTLLVAGEALKDGQVSAWTLEGGDISLRSALESADPGIIERIVWSRSRKWLVTLSWLRYTIWSADRHPLRRHAVIHIANDRLGLAKRRQPISISSDERLAALADGAGVAVIDIEERNIVWRVGSGPSSLKLLSSLNRAREGVFERTRERVAAAGGR